MRGSGERKRVREETFSSNIDMRNTGQFLSQPLQGQNDRGVRATHNGVLRLQCHFLPNTSEPLNVSAEFSIAYYSYLI